MLGPDFILKNKDTVIGKLRKRGFENTALVEELGQIVEERKSQQTALDQSREELNRFSKAIGADKTKLSDLRTSIAELKTTINHAETTLKELKAREQNLLCAIPNLPHDSVPPGLNPTENKVVYEHNPRKREHGRALDHLELGRKYNIIDFNSGAKLMGSGFPIMRGKGARLERALINFFLDKATEKGYEEFIPPLIVNEKSVFSTGQLPDKDEQMYYCATDEAYLIPTAEVPLTNLYRDTLLKPEALPVKLTAYSACFRREAGSYGSMVRGLNRVHQFNKVEIVQIVKPDESYKTLEEMCKHIDELLSTLGLRYRMLHLCAGDLGFTSATTYDFEVYSPGQELWLEVSSASNFETFQSRRLNLRYKVVEKHTAYLHTLNASALALPRILVGVLEQYQDKDLIHIPEALWPYTGFKHIS